MTVTLHPFKEDASGSSIVPFRGLVGWIEFTDRHPEPWFD